MTHVAQAVEAAQARSVSRRAVLAAALPVAGGWLGNRALAAPTWPSQPQRVENITRLYGVQAGCVLVPQSVGDVQAAVAAWPGCIAVGGARCSMGGQTAIEGGLHLDMRGMDRLVWLHPTEKTVRVQAGMRWRDLQDHIDPHGLAVRTMQSYANFTVGGSVSVNAHGRYVGHGALAGSVRALQLVLADASVVETSRSDHPDLFSAALGGYSAVGVVTEVELDLDCNLPLERRVVSMPLRDYPRWFASQVAQDPSCVLHNADLLPPTFGEATAVSWRATDRQPTIAERLVPRDADYALERQMLRAVTELRFGEALQRHAVRPLLLRKDVVAWRNREASLDLRMLEPASRTEATYALQEYFVPVRHFLRFAAALQGLVQVHRAQVLNVSVRHAPPDPDALMCWAREEVFCFVVYYRQRTDATAMAAVAGWTRCMIDAALACGGTYYLPYQLHATAAQFAEAYPQADAFRAVKRRVDPRGRLSNTLWSRYL